MKQGMRASRTTLSGSMSKVPLRKLQTHEPMMLAESCERWRRVG